ncbi:alpha/beta fold hydrolase [Phenylobacterium sp.]|uniref:alpha/beta fold hydrolase n=1 Tax=Phenylobacterium sp. TaxID=1871053 RepID=UPI002736FCE3|nr:alpha/beta fold hydrolase [Phenylobacterium sp.]MDP3659765.1 alpha/beta fold hydrolase [Phenylobacterium sp.]
MAQAARGFHPPRGEMIDLGGRRMRLVREGAASTHPTILCEAGSFGSASDWAVVQEMLAADGLRSLAYDRAGLGYSDPGPIPRHGRAIVEDLERLLEQAGEPGPFVLVGHSMAGLWVRLFAVRNPDKVAGLVLVDAATAETIEAPMIRHAVERYARASLWWSRGAGLGLARPVAALYGDNMELAGAAAAEKRRIFGMPHHHRAAADEVAHWGEASEQARAAGAYRAEWPVAVITAGVAARMNGLKQVQSEPAHASLRGHVEHVAGANHANLLGRRFADRIIAGVRHVLAIG